jgi:hypothetical protein
MKSFNKFLQISTGVLVLGSFAMANELSVNVGMLNLPGEYKYEKYTQQFTNGIASASTISKQEKKDLGFNVMTVRFSSMKPTTNKRLTYGTEFGFSSTATLEKQKFENPASTNTTNGVFELEYNWFPETLNSNYTKKNEHTLDVNVLPFMGKIAYDIISNDTFSLNAGMGIGVYTYLMNDKKTVTTTYVNDMGTYRKAGDVEVTETNTTYVVVKPAVELNLSGNINLTKNIFIGLNAGVVSVEKYISNNDSTIDRQTDYDDATKHDRAVKSKNNTEIGGIGYNAGVNLGVKF